MYPLRVGLLALGLLVVLAGLVAHEAWQPLHNAAVLGLALWPLLVALGGFLLARLLRLRTLAGIAVVATLPLVYFAGPAVVLATMVLLAASLGLGSLVTGRGDESAPIALLVGLGLITGIAGWLLPVPLFHQVAVGLALLGVVAWRRREIMALGADWKRALAIEARARPRALAGMVLLLSVATSPSWLPVLSADDLSLHLLVPWRLMEQGAHRFDVGSQVWALAPWLGDVAHGLVQVLSRQEGIGPLNVAWLLLATWFVQRIAVTIGLDPVLSWLSAALFASLPLAGGLTMGMQTETASAALVGALALVVLRAPEQASPRPLYVAAVLCGFLLGLKVLNGAFIAPVGVLLLWRWRGRLPWRHLAPATALGLLVGGASYTYSWWLAGNPLLPLYNGVFQSPWFSSAENIKDVTWVKSVGLLLPWDITFRTTEYFEGYPGAAGFVLLGLLGGAVAGLADRRVRPLLLVGLVAWALPFSQLQYLRYTHPAMVLLVPALVAGLAMGVGDRRPRFLLAGGLALVVLQQLFLTSASWILNGNAVRMLAGHGRDAVLERYAPERLVARHARSHLGPTDRILFASRTNAYRGEFGDRAFVSNWYDSQTQSLALDNPDEQAGWAAALAHTGANHILERDSLLAPGLKSFLVAHQARQVAKFGDVTLYRVPEQWRPGELVIGEGGLQSAGFLPATDGPVLVVARVQMACSVPFAPIAVSWTVAGAPGPGEPPAWHAWIPCGADGRAVLEASLATSSGQVQMWFSSRPINEGVVRIERHDFAVRNDLGRRRDLWKPAEDASLSVLAR